jgi:predicted Fe-S protein YdhL (DUF1289 family)
MSLTNKSTTNIESPCVRNCCLNGDDICLGCFRHIDEILAWKSYKNSEKQAVNSSCQQRRLLAECKLSKGSC